MTDTTENKEPSAEESPPRKPLRLRDVVILAEDRHEISGARLVMAEIKNHAAPGSYAVAWIAPWQRKVTDYTPFESLNEAAACFEGFQQQPPPRTPSIIRDWQKTAVYRWEGDNIGKGTARLTEGQMKRVAAQVSRDFNIAAPDIKHCKPKGSPGEAMSWYIQDDNAILMHHKDMYLVLHELAHAVDVKLNGNKWADHGPSYVRTMITLAEKYHWCDSAELEQAAEKCKIIVAKRDALPLPKP